MEALTDAVDVDLGSSPLTNSLPVLRSGIGTHLRSVELQAAWVSVPDLSIKLDSQRYTWVGCAEGSSHILYEAIDGSFSSEISFDGDGLVVSYPGIAQRVP